MATTTEETSLQRDWRFAKEFLPRTRLARWAEFTGFFRHREERCHAATQAIYAIRDAGPKDRERWKREYRHQRRLVAITQGRATERPVIYCPGCGDEMPPGTTPNTACGECLASIS